MMDYSVLDYGDYSPYDVGTPDDATILQGDGSSYPVISDNEPQMDTSVLQKLGSIDITKTARDVGTLVGSTQAAIKNAGSAYHNAQQAALNPNPLATWWQYASTTDKLVVGIAAATLLYMVVKS